MEQQSATNMKRLIILAVLCVVMFGVAGNVGLSAWQVVAPTGEDESGVKTTSRRNLPLLAGSTRRELLEERVYDVNSFIFSRLESENGPRAMVTLLSAATVFSVTAAIIDAAGFIGWVDSAGDRVISRYNVLTDGKVLRERPGKSNVVLALSTRNGLGAAIRY